MTAAAAAEEGKGGEMMIVPGVQKISFFFFAVDECNLVIASSFECHSLKRPEYYQEHYGRGVEFTSNTYNWQSAWPSCDCWPVSFEADRSEC
jgi:hypothetical protein